MTFRAASVLVFLTGFIALSLELVWIRQYYFLSSTRAFAFAALLSSYLLGLALGSFWSMKVQRKFENAPLAEQSASVARLVLWANIAGFVLTPLISWIASLRILPCFSDPSGFQPYTLTYPLVVVVAGWLGTLLPLICHFSVPPDERVGSRLSKLYLANIVGSGAGSLLTGFVLMEHIPLRWISFFLLMLGVMIYVVLSRWTERAVRLATWTLIVGALATPVVYWQFWERMQQEYQWGPGQDFEQIVESRHGVITVDKEHKIYGGGCYDGVMTVSPMDNSWLVRAYALSAMHPNPEDVLVVGLSGGSWAQITAANPAVKSVTCIEINHSYEQEIIPAYPAVASLVKNPKVKIITDDGRRWLARNPHRKFDAMLMNTTQHYREFASNLLSREFLELSLKHLKPGGVFQYNATGSLRAQQTALNASENVMLLLNNIVIWNGPPQWDTLRWKTVLENYRIDGKPVFDLRNPAHRLTMEKMLALRDTPGKEPSDLIDNPLWTSDQDRRDFRLRTRAQIERACREKNAVPITDDNLGHEYRWWTGPKPE